MNESNRFIEEFCNEAEELLAGVEDAVLDIEDNPSDQEAVNRLFRAMHTIKGSGAMFGFDAISEFTHHVETTLDNVRNGTVGVTKELIDLILLSRDRITAMLAEANGQGPPTDPEQGDKIIASLKALISSGGSPAPAEGTPENEPEKAPEQPPAETPAQGDNLVMKIEGTLSAYDVEDLKERLLDGFTNHPGIIMDVKNVTECDTLGLQLLLSAWKTAEKLKKTFDIIGDSQAVQDAVTGVGVDTEDFPCFVKEA